jgi:alkylation response protein AidB-like acyl-CoA dehydrogenase
LVAGLVKALRSEADGQMAAETIHIHGGIGFTAEHDAHRLVRRAQSSAAMLGRPTYHRELAATHLVDGAT